MRFTPKNPQDEGPTTSDWPTFYLYQGEGAKWYKSDATLTGQINRHVFLNEPLETNGCAFYPQWPEPAFKSETRIAWNLAADGSRQARWCWQVVAHKKSHGKCKPIGNGKCGVKVLLKLGWNAKTNLWTLVENPDAATKDQIKQINAA